MRAANFHKPGDIRIEQVHAPKLQKPTDAIVRITHTAIGEDGQSQRSQGPSEALKRPAHRQ
jgi:alcohol dehydrogenase